VPKAWYVDDDEDMITAVSLMLQLMSYQTRPFRDARSAAKALLDGGKPDLIFLDINLPEVNGIELLRFIRSRSKWDTVPVVMLSSEAADVQVDEAIRIGADDYTIKPVMYEELLEVIERVTKSRRAKNS
jgi:DNA-binding response OmpR family regulator